MQIYLLRILLPGINVTTYLRYNILLSSLQTDCILQEYE